MLSGYTHIYALFILVIIDISCFNFIFLNKVLFNSIQLGLQNIEWSSL